MGRKALAEIIARHIDHRCAGAVVAHRVAGEDQILAERRAGRGKTIDPEFSGQRRRKPALEGLGIWHHLRLDERVADHRDQRRPLAHVVLVVDIAGIIHPAAHHGVEVPAERVDERPVGREPQHRVCGVHRHAAQSARDGQEAQHDLGRQQADDDAEQRQQQRECEVLAAAHAAGRSIHPQVPVNTGLRFSMKALRPSM